MKRILERFKQDGSLHHAYLIISQEKEPQSELEEILGTISGEVLRGNPDYYFWEDDSFGIDLARALKIQHHKENIGTRQFFVIKTFLTLPPLSALIVQEVPIINDLFNAAFFKLSRFIFFYL